MSEEGAQQGDPLGPAYFCLAIRKLLSSLKSELVVAYLDDITLGDDAETIAIDFAEICRCATEKGLSLNGAKCEIIGATETSRSILKQHQIDLPETDISVACLPGSPLTKDQSMTNAILSKRNELESLISRLQYMPAHDS